MCMGGREGIQFVSEVLNYFGAKNTRVRARE